MTDPPRAAALRQQIAGLVTEYTELTYAPRPFVAGVTPIPPSGKVVGAAELKNMVEASLDGRLTTESFNDADQRLARRDRYAP